MKVKANKAVRRFKVPTAEPPTYCHNRKSIVHFQESYDIFTDYLEKADFNAIPYSVRHYLRFFESFEPQTYYVMTDESGVYVTAVDSCNGDIFEENIPLQEFIARTLHYCGENVIEEEM